MRRVLVLLLAAATLAVVVEANFAAAPGFSGRVADCTSCHRPPVDGDDAQVAVSGIPAGWTPNTTYDWIVEVTGGPAVVPGGPEAGFELEVLSGTVAPGPDATGDVRNFHSKQVTYTEEGVRQRSWSVSWTAPDLSQYPSPITVWVAGMAANGNHNTDLNISDAGEHGDSVHNTSYVIPPTADTLDAWRALPLAAPTVDLIQSSNGRHTLEGRLNDANATMIEVHDGSAWVGRNVGPVWKLSIQGDGDVRIRSAGAERVSPDVLVDLGSGTVVDPAHVDEESPSIGLVITVAALALARRLQ